MNDYERAQRIAAWTWAAQTLGVEVTAERLDGLVEVTSNVRTDTLQPALEAALRTEVSGFLPSPGAVMAAARRIAERRSAGLLPAGREVGPEQHERLMRQLNPDGWDQAKVEAFVARCGRDPGFRRRAQDAHRERVAWVDRRIEEEVGQRRVSIGFRRKLRLEYQAEAYAAVPRPDPGQVKRSGGVADAFSMGGSN